MAFGFRFRGWQLKQGALHIWFRNKAGRQITFVALRKPGDCAAGREKTFQLAGNKSTGRTPRRRSRPGDA